MEKLFFIDTNVLTACACSELEGHDIAVLEKILGKLEEGRVHLLMPEIIQKEVEKKIDSAFRELNKESELSVSDFKATRPAGEHGSGNKYAEVKAKKITQIRKDAVSAANENVRKKLEENRIYAINIVEKIYKHKNTVVIPLETNDLLAGMRRACLLKRPSSCETKPQARHYIKDADCIAFEQILRYLAGAKLAKHLSSIIFCSDDGDYFEEDKLHSEITKELSVFSKIQKGYRSPIAMLEEEFSVKFSHEQKEEYKQSAERVSFEQHLLEQYFSGWRTAARGRGSSFERLSSGSPDARILSSDAKSCPECGAQVTIDTFTIRHNRSTRPYAYFGHKGIDWRCPVCDTGFEIRDRSPFEL